MEGWVDQTVKGYSIQCIYILLYQSPIIYLIVYLILLIDQTALDAGQEFLGTVETFEH